LNPARWSPTWLALILLTALGGGFLAACGAAPSLPTARLVGPTPTVTVPVELPVVVSMAGRFSGPGLTTLDEMIATFEAANPDVKVELVDVRGGADQQRRTIVGCLNDGDTSVDVYALNNTWLAELFSTGGLHPLDSYVESGSMDTSRFLPSAVQASTIGGRLVALPWTVDGGLLYYRADLLDKYGYAPPTDWAEVQRIALEIKAKEGLPAGFVWQGKGGETLTCDTLEFVWAYGGDVLDGSGNTVFNSPQSQIALRQMRTLVTSGASPHEITTHDDSASFRAFESGDAVLLRHWAGAWALLNKPEAPLAGRVGMAHLPASCLTGQSLALSAFSPHPDQAARWLAFLGSYEQQVQWALATGQLPALKTAYDDADLRASAPSFEALAAALAVARPLPQIAAYPAASEAIYTEVNHLLVGEQDAETTAARIQSRLEEILGQR
jgi:multiple sugar transport system substrate-binding protein